MKIWIDKNQVAANKASLRAGVKGPLPPVFLVKRSTGIVRANSVAINGPSRLVYDPAGSCSTAWIEVDDEATVVLG